MAVLYDMRYFKVPNILQIILLILQLLSIFNSLFFEKKSVEIYPFFIWLVTLSAALFLLFPFFSIGALGAGDYKLLVILMLRIEKPFVFLFEVFITAALLSLIQMLKNRNLKIRLNFFLAYLNQVLNSQKLTPYHSPTLKAREKANYSIHFTIPIFVVVAANKLPAALSFLP